MVIELRAPGLTCTLSLSDQTQRFNCIFCFQNNVSMLKTPIRKVKGHFTTGHANSPAPIVIGKAHTSIVNAAVQVPKVMINYPLKKHDDLNESFTGKLLVFW